MTLCIFIILINEGYQVQIDKDVCIYNIPVRALYATLSGVGFTFTVRYLTIFLDPYVWL